MDKLVVIGNGFDLSIDANTSYGDFFISDYYKSFKETAEKWIEVGLQYPQRIISHYYFKLEKDEMCNCWDILFNLETRADTASFSEEIHDWCDIEAVIHRSLTGKNRKEFSWKRVYDLLHLYYSSHEDAALFSCPQVNSEKETQIMCIFMINNGWEDSSGDISKFFDRLLNDLNTFEKSFGHYITLETRDDEYKKRAHILVEKLIRCKLEGSTDKVRIDSFNYSDFSGNYVDIRHINGDCNNPIFGIDLKEDEESFPRIHSFTKTSRRLKQDAHKQSNIYDNGIDNLKSAIVFGHSLNQMDYDYFNYLFTLLKFNTFDVEKMGSIEFVYRIYDSDKQYEIRTHYADLVYKVINYYEKYVSNSSQHVLINSKRKVTGCPIGLRSF